MSKKPTIKPETIEDALTLVAARVMDTYAVGEFSQFMDEPADFDTVDTADLATTIGEVIAEMGWQLKPTQTK